MRIEGVREVSIYYKTSEMECVCDKEEYICYNDRGWKMFIVMEFCYYKEKGMEGVCCKINAQ